METFTYFLLFIIFYFLMRQFLRKFQDLPASPFLALPMIGQSHLLKTPLHRTLAKISNQYGPVLFLQFGSRPVLLVSSPSAAEDCFSKNDIVFANRPRILAGQYLGYNYTTVVWASYGQHWRNLRRIASIELLSTARLQSFSSFRLHEVRSLLRRLYRGSSSWDGEFYAVEMKSVFLELTFNIMMRMIAGKRYCGDDETAGSEETRRFKEIMAGSLRLSGPSIGDFVPLLKWVGWNGLEKKLRMLQEKRDGFMGDLIEKHRRNHQSCSDEQQRRKTMIDVLLSLQENDPEYYTDEIIRGMMLVWLP